MTGSPVLILGAGSDIGQAIARAFAAEGHPIQLAARNVTRLDPVRSDIALRHGVEVTLHEFDVLDTDSLNGFVDGLPSLPQVAVCVVGLMGTQEDNQRDQAQAQRILRSNFEGPAAILALLANRFEARGTGTLVGVSSVAGERGRATNYVYGSAKAGFTAFLSGLRNRLAGAGVHVVTVLPGFVNTAMTEGLDLPGKLTAEPHEVGAAVLRAVRKKRDVIHVRRIWWLIMAIIRNIPERIFKKLKL